MSSLLLQPTNLHTVKNKICVHIFDILNQTQSMQHNQGSSRQVWVKNDQRKCNSSLVTDTDVGCSPSGKHTNLHTKHIKYIMCYSFVLRCYY